MVVKSSSRNVSSLPIELVAVCIWPKEAETSRACETQLRTDRSNWTLASVCCSTGKLRVYERARNEIALSACQLQTVSLLVW